METRWPSAGPAIEPAPCLATPCRYMSCCQITSFNKNNHYPCVTWYRRYEAFITLLCLRRSRSREVEDCLHVWFKARLRYRRGEEELPAMYFVERHLALRLIRRDRSSPGHYYSVPARLIGIQFPYSALFTRFELACAQPAVPGDEVWLGPWQVGRCTAVEADGLVVQLPGGLRLKVASALVVHRHVNPARVLLPHAFGLRT